MKLKNLFIAAFGALAMLGATSCNESGGGNGGSGDLFYLDIATIESSGDAGTVLTLRQNGDSPLVTLMTQQRFNDDDFKTGERVVISYHPVSNKQYESGNIYIQGAGATIGRGFAPKEATAEETHNWESDAVQMLNVWRTGEYVNLVFQATTSTDPRLCELYIDKASTNLSTPELRLIFKRIPGAMNSTYTFYASYNIGDLWNKDGVKGLRIICPDSNMLGGNTVNIIKDASSLQPIN